MTCWMVIACFQCEATMTIKILADYPYSGNITIPAGRVVGVFDAKTEAGLIAANLAIVSVAMADWTVPDLPYLPSEPSDRAVAQLAQPFCLGDLTTAAFEIRARFPLRSSLVASVYQGEDAVVTFSRNNAGNNGFTTVRDHLGYLGYCRTDEAPFRGARRVENLVQDSDLLTTGWAVEGSTTKSAAANGLGRRYDRATASTTMNTLSNMTLEPGVHVFSCNAWVESGSATLRIRIERADTTLVVTKDISLSVTSKRIAVAGLVPDIAQQTKVLIGIVSGSAVHFCMGQAQFERIASGTYHPNEYVPRGVVGAVYPFHGAGVDGVRYFETVNPCYLETSGTVLTDTTPGGVAIDSGTLTGLQRSPIAIQRLFYSSTFDNVAWTKTGVTAAQVTSVDNPIGYGRAYRLSETAVTSAMTASGAWNGSIAADNLNLAVSAFFKRNVGRDWVRIGLVNKAGATDMIWYNLATQTLGTITSGSGTVTAKDVVIEAYPNGWYRVGFGGASAGTGATTPSAFVGVADADGSASYLGVLGSSIYVAAAQLEQADHPTAYIGNSAGAVVQRSGECIVQVPIISNVPANDFTIGVEFTPHYKTDTIRKSDFYYIAYSYVNGTNRWGTALRGGLFAGNVNDQLASGWAQDYFPNAAGFGGTNITLGVVPNPFTTVTQLFGQSATARHSNGDGSFMAVNGVVAYSTLSATPTLDPILNKQAYLRLGSSLQTGKHDASYKNLIVIGRALSDYELSIAGRPA